MYLGLFIMLVGWACYLANIAALPFPFLFVIVITRLQIVPEERALRQRFGIEFERYKHTVRRWI